MSPYVCQGYYMSLSRKHFEAIAHTLDANRADLALVEDFADMCAEFNPLFDRKRFVTAATIKWREWQSYELDQLKKRLGDVVE